MDSKLRGQVSRTYTFGVKGTSQGQFSKLLRATNPNTNPNEPEYPTPPLAERLAEPWEGVK